MFMNRNVMKRIDNKMFLIGVLTKYLAKFINLHVAHNDSSSILIDKGYHIPSL